MPRKKINPDFTPLTCKTCGQIFQAKWEKRKTQRYCSRTCSNRDVEVLEKMKSSQKKTFVEKYGCHPMKTAETKERFKTSMKDRYGVEHALQSDVLLDLAKKTTVEHYGVENVFHKDSPIREQIQSTIFEKYGVDNVAKSPEIIEKRRKNRNQNHYDDLKKYLSDRGIEWLTSRSDYTGYHFSNKYKFKCVKCSHTFETDVYLPETVFCEKCYPTRKNTGENTLYNFLTEELPGVIIKRNDRTILEGKELDIYIPSLKLAIEYDGLYWHRETSVTCAKNYHLNKTKSCEEKGIRLIHIFEPEWINKSNIVKSILRQMIGSIITRVYARECDIRSVSYAEKKEFLKNCHIQGNDNASISYGLYYKGSLISLMTFCRSRFDREYQWEISRFCTALNTTIVGGASKLFSNFISDHTPESIVSYSDRRFFNGKVYEKLGMTFDGYTSQGYHYITPDFKGLINRMSYQKGKLKKKLQKFDPNLSEWENMKMNGFDRIWDCGHSKWIYKRPTK